MTRFCFVGLPYVLKNKDTFISMFYLILGGLNKLQPKNREFQSMSHKSGTAYEYMYKLIYVHVCIICVKPAHYMFKKNFSASLFQTELCHCSVIS